MAFNSQEFLKTLNKEHSDLSGGDVLCAVSKHIPLERICLVSSFGIESGVLLKLAADLDKAFPVIFLDTQKLFPETLEYRDLLVKKLGLKNVKTIYPDYNDVMRSDSNGTLWQNNANSCCTIRKVQPLQRALKNYDVVITGRKRFHGGMRTKLPLYEAQEGRVKINPLASWSIDEIKALYDTFDLPRHPMEAQGYLSVGCVPCTDLPDETNDVRSGRWKGQDKEECGIHLGPDGKFQRSNS